MKNRWSCVVSLALVGLVLIPDFSEGGWRRRCRCCPCQPVVVCCAPVPAVAPAVATVTIGHKTYSLFDTVDQGEFTEPKRPPVLTGAGIPDDDAFNGEDRMVPKTTIVTAETEVFSSVAGLLGPLVHDFPDADMKKMGIKKTTNKRVDAENRSVRVRGFIHAFKKEGDNDYHVIFGDGPNSENPVFLNVEVSGIPEGGTKANRQQLIAARKKFQQQFNLGATGPNGYKRPHEPIPVQVTGSLFWDVDHPPGAVGPSDMKPTTAWEIHPVSSIDFLDN